MRQLTPHGDFASIGPVHLDVTDRQRSLAFWRDLIGLQVRSESPESVSLGTSERTLLVLDPVATTVAHPGYTGLYHVAIHPPDEAAFAVLLGRLIEGHVPISPSDHTFSKAVYLSAPDNGTRLPPAPPGMARPRSYTIHYADPERLATVLRGIRGATQHPDGTLVRDPSGNTIILT